MSNPVVLTAIGVIGLPTLGFMIRMTMKWTQMSDRLMTIARDMERLVRSADETHRDLERQMHADRVATNERLTWLERNLWKRGPMAP